MIDILKGQFYSPTKGELTLKETMEEMASYMREESRAEYEVIVGCDSSAVSEPTFPLVIVVLRKGEGGRFFLQKVKYPDGKKFYNLHDRILQEVLLSCELALFLRENFSYDDLKYDFEYIHADIGKNGKTKEMIKEVTGLIRGNGFEPVIKPLSFAASSVADRYA